MNLLLAFVIFTGDRLARDAVRRRSRSRRSRPARRRAAAGLKPGEAIVAIDGQRYDWFDGDLADRRPAGAAGQTVVLTIAAASTARDGTSP